MNNYTKNLALDIGKKYLLSPVYAKQGDMASRYLTITLMNGDEQYKPASGNTAKFRALKPDGNSVMNTATINSDGTVTCELTAQTLACAGIVKADVVILDGNSKALASASFDIAVERAPIGEDIESKDEFKEILELIDEASAAVSAANTAASKANTAASSASTAAGKANTAASSATSAASSAGTAASSANSAATSAKNAASSANSAASSATSAASSANTAATAANTAAEEAENVNISATQTATGADITVTGRDGAATTVHVDTLLATDTWEGKRNAIRLGLGPKLYPVGHEFTTDFTYTSQTYPMTWKVVAHNHHPAANGRLEHTMTLETKYVLSYKTGYARQLMFSTRQGLYYAAEGLPAGTYNMTISGRADRTSDNGKTIQFTLTQDLPAGGWLRPNRANTSTLIGAYMQCILPSGSTQESVSTAEGTEGTHLGTTGEIGTNFNHVLRSIYGSSNYAQSIARFFLNCNENSATFAATKFDIPYSVSQGFCYGLPDDFLSVVEPAIIPCRTKGDFEVASLDGTEFGTNQTYQITSDKFFLLSYPEFAGKWDTTTVKDGGQLEYYEGITDFKKIDVKEIACESMTRSPADERSIRTISSSGKISSGNAAYTSLYMTVACIIA